MVQKVWYTYDDIHKSVKTIAEKIRQSGEHYDAMIAIGGGGFIPARILRTFLDIPIYTVTTAYYLSETEGETADSVQKVQWLDPVPEELRGKNVLIVDEVDDSRVTMEFVLNELKKDGFGKIGVAVVHNKLKPKVGRLSQDVAYFCGIEIEDWWIHYPWDAADIDTHNRRAHPDTSETATGNKQ